MNRHALLHELASYKKKKPDLSFKSFDYYQNRTKLQRYILSP